MILPYSVQVECTTDLTSSLSSAVKLKIKEMKTVCIDQNCTNVNVSGSCNGSRAVDAYAEITGLP